MSMWSRLTGIFGSQRDDPSISPAADDDDDEFEGGLEPNTAALMDGAPPSGASGRAVPTGPSTGDPGAHGTDEGETENLPG